MFLIDSSAWIDYLSDGPASAALAHFFEKPEAIIVPSLIIFEVSKYFLKTMDEDGFLPTLAHMQDLQQLPLNDDIAFRAALLSKDFKLGLADSIILASAKHTGATLITLDNDFRNIPGCRVISKT